MAGDHPLLSVIVVSYNTRDLTLACVKSVTQHAPPIPYEIIVVDNGSSDGSADSIRAEFPEARLLANQRNLGFAAANNQAFELARGDYFLLLNPDTEVLNGALGDVLAFADDHPDIGVIGCRVRYPNGLQQSTVFRYLRLSTLVLNLFVPNRWIRRSRWLGRSRYVGIDLDRVQDVEVVAGCFMLVRRLVVEAVGRMDEGFFMFGEEADWCYRIRRAGWRVVYFPDATILHHGGRSARQYPEEMLRAMALSQLRLIDRTQGRWAAYLANLLMLLRDLPRAAVWYAFRSIPPLGRSSLGRHLRPAVARVGIHLRGVVRPRWSEGP